MCRTDQTGKRGPSLKKTVRTITALAAAAVIFLPYTVPASETESALLPTEDYSYYAGASADSNGYLYLTDNRTIEDVRELKLRMKNFEFTIPGAWADNVVIRTLYLNQTKSSNLYKTQIFDSYVIRFYEKETWMKYHSDTYENQKNASSMGELAEIRLMNSTKNDISRWKNDPLYIHFGTVTKEKTEYEAFLYHPKTSDGLIDPDYSSRYGYLTDINYQGCLISSFACRNGFSLKYPNAYIKNHYVADFRKDAEGIKKGSRIPDGYVPKTLLDEKNSSDEAPGKLNSVSENLSANSYSWESFKAPWRFSDRGASYYQNLMTDAAQITAVPTITVTPEATPTPSTVPEETPAPTEVPSEKPSATASPTPTATPVPTATPTPEVSSTPTNPEPEEDEE